MYYFTDAAYDASVCGVVCCLSTKHGISLSILTPTETILGAAKDVSTFSCLYNSSLYLSIPVYFLFMQCCG